MDNIREHLTDVAGLRVRLLQLLGLNANDPVLLPQRLPLLFHLLLQTVLIGETQR